MSKVAPWRSTDNDFARSFSPLLQSGCGREKSQKKSGIVGTKALKFIKFRYDDGDKEEDVVSPHNLIDYALGRPQLLTKFLHCFGQYFDECSMDVFDKYFSNS